MPGLDPGVLFNRQVLPRVMQWFAPGLVAALLVLAHNSLKAAGDPTLERWGRASKDTVCKQSDRRLDVGLHIRQLLESMHPAQPCRPQQASQVAAQRLRSCFCKRSKPVSGEDVHYALTATTLL